jgi:hypothetical protein
MRESVSGLQFNIPVRAQKCDSPIGYKAHPGREYEHEVLETGAVDWNLIDDLGAAVGDYAGRNLEVLQRRARR